MNLPLFARIGLSVACAGALLLACGSSEDTTKNDERSTGTPDSGRPADAAGEPLPDDLAECTTTPSAPVGGPQFVGLAAAAPFGALVRDGRIPVGPSAVTFGSRRFDPEPGELLTDDDGPPISAPVWTQFRWLDLTDQRDVVTAYLANVEFYENEHVFYTFESEQIGYAIDGLEPSAPAADELPGDEIVTGLTGLSYWRVDVALRFPNDSACHLANLRKVLGRADSFLELSQLAGNAQDAARVQAYFDRMLERGESLPSVSIHSLVTNEPGEDALKLGLIEGCSATSFAGCAQVRTRVQAAHQAFLAKRGAPTEAMLAGETPMPFGWAFATAGVTARTSF